MRSAGLFFEPTPPGGANSRAGSRRAGCDVEARLLRAIGDEIRRRLTEQEVQRVSDLGTGRLLLRFHTPDRDNLLLSLRADLPRLYLLPRGGGRREVPPGPFAVALERELAGAHLEAVRVPVGERIADLSFRRTGPHGAGVTRRLVVELFGRAAAAHLLDENGVVLATTRREEARGGSAIAGQPYRAPAARTASRDAGAGGPPGLPAEGDPADVDLEFEVHSVRPLEELTESVPLGRDDLVLRPGAGGAERDEPDVTGMPRHVTRFSSPSEAAAAVFERLERRRDFEAERARHEARARKEVTRLATLETRLARDREAAGRALEGRRHAEALLAGLHAARVEGSVAVVPDPESPDGATMTVPIDPALPLAASAQRLFDRVKKGKRALIAIDTRLAAAARRRAAWEDIEARTRTAATADDLEPLREAMAALGLVHRAPRPGREAGVTTEAPTRVRRHTTRDGFVILVGKSGPENDTLTFKVASPWDFWLHAAGHPGAHVVVRNPRRLGSLPENALRTAAEIAAYYSGAREAGKVEVHVTQRKHVRKRKGAPPGQVLLRRFQSIQVVPRLPGPPIEDL